MDRFKCKAARCATPDAFVEHSVMMASVFAVRICDACRNLWEQHCRASPVFRAVLVADAKFNAHIQVGDVDSLEADVDALNAAKVAVFEECARWLAEARPAP